MAVLPKKDFHPSIFVLTDISNEPDDAESFVRLLLYSNEVNIKGVVATTSHWLKNKVFPQDLRSIVDKYAEVHENLLKHDPNYPTAEYIHSIITTGHPVYGLKAFQEKELSDGAKKLIAAVESTPNDESLYILVWGGANVLAEALNEIKKRDGYDVDLFVKKILVYSISDQDDCGNWIRSNFPKLRYIASMHGFNQYNLAAWTGISGETYYNFDKGGPDTDLITKEWTEKNIMSVGPLGKAYLPFFFIPEGDTPSTLFVLPNGLNCPDHPEYGSWGGRYLLSDMSKNSMHYSDAVDNVIGKNGEKFISNHATIWRWREAYQNDFAARMQWTVKPFDETPHQPIVVLDDTTSYTPYVVEAVVGSEVTLDASKSYDLNGAEVEFKWFHYREPTLIQSNVIECPEIEIVKLNESGSKVKLQVPDFKAAFYSIFRDHLAQGKAYHFILEVVSKTSPPLSTYRRVILQTTKGDNEFPDEEDTKTPFEVHDEL